MFPGATLFLDVCVQEELWPSGSWPLVDAEQAANVELLFGLARAWPIRQGGVMCRHTPDGLTASVGMPPHCGEAETWSARPAACAPASPLRLVGSADADAGESLARGTAVYLDSGCATAPDGSAAHARAFALLTAGIRDAVVFGAGIEHGMARVIDALLSRRIRTHVAIDAAGAGDQVRAQVVVGEWKRRGIDVTTVAMIDRLLQRN